MGVPGQTIEAISSGKNPLLKEIRRAAHRGTLTPDGCAVAEGFHLLREALRSRTPVKAILHAESAAPEVDRELTTTPPLRRIVLPDRLFHEIATTEHSQGVITLAAPPHWDWDHLLPTRPLLLVLDGLQDPGNAGGAVRLAEAFGATGVVFAKGSAHPWNPKTLRASAGSLFRVPMLAGVEPAEVRTRLESAGIDLYAAMPRGDTLLGDADLTRPAAFIIGSEGRGVSETFRLGLRTLRIPTEGVESLNAAMAAAVLLYEARRQRMERP